MNPEFFRILLSHLNKPVFFYLKITKNIIFIKKAQKESAFYDFDIKGLDNYFEENKFKRFCMRNG